VRNITSLLWALCLYLYVTSVWPAGVFWNFELKLQFCHLACIESHPNGLVCHFGAFCMTSCLYLWCSEVGGATNKLACINAGQEWCENDSFQGLEFCCHWKSIKYPECGGSILHWSIGVQQYNCVVP
jgi:hypothetical protein